MSAFEPVAAADSRDSVTGCSTAKIWSCFGAQLREARDDGTTPSALVATERTDRRRSASAKCQRLIARSRTHGSTEQSETLGGLWGGLRRGSIQRAVTAPPLIVFASSMSSRNEGRSKRRIGYDQQRRRTDHPDGRERRDRVEGEIRIKCRVDCVTTGHGKQRVAVRRRVRHEFRCDVASRANWRSS